MKGFQKTISQLEIHGEVIPQENIIKSALQQQKAYESEVKGTSSTNHKTPTMLAFMSSNSTNLVQLYQLRLLQRVKKIPEEIHKKLDTEPTKKEMGLTMSQSDQAEEGPTNFALMAYSSTTSSSSTNFEDKVKTDYELAQRLQVEEQEELTIEEKSKLFQQLLEKRRKHFAAKRAEERRNGPPTKAQQRSIMCTYLKNMAGWKPKDLKTNQIIDKCKTGLGYNVVPPPYIGNFMPPKPNLVYPSLDDFIDVNESVSEFVVEKTTVETNKPKTAKKENGAPIIEDWVSEREEEDEPNFKQQDTYSTSFGSSRSPKGNKRNWNQQMSQKLGNDFKMFKKACHVCVSFDHLKNDCNNWSGLISLNTASPFNTVQPRTTVNNAGPIKNIINNAYSTARRPFNKITAANNSNFTKKANTVKDKNVNTTKPKAVVNTARPNAVLNAVKKNKGNDVKALECLVQGDPQQGLKDKGVISGCSRHMTGNRSYLTNYEEIDGGFVAFGGNSKGVKINGKSIIRTDFKLTDKSHVLLKVPRKDNMYSVNLKNVIPQGGRKPALSFMRLFECPVIILNTIDHLGSGPNWLFNIDALTKSMNYKLVVAGNQSNGHASTKACDDAGKARMETIPSKDYILLPLWTTDPPLSQDSKSSPNDGFKHLGDDEKKITKDLGTESERDDQEKENNVNITNNVNAASTNEVNAGSVKTSIELQDDPNMPELEDIVYSEDDKEVGA
ncbi:hypothetical protein Tco_0412884 [Tanacetum coccineum]